jgi:tRNA uridine 5-carbamoylmethylation protein Kti12
MQSPIFVVSGPPAAGKTTISRALLQNFERGLHIPVDDLREWVVKGIAHPIQWSEETTRQFTLAEEAAADLAIRYQDAGFAVAIDHCQGPPTLDQLVQQRFAGRAVVKLAIVCSLDLNLHRNASRGGKWFEPEILIKTITKLNRLYQNEPISDSGWAVIDNSGSIEETVAAIQALSPSLFKADATRHS